MAKTDDGQEKAVLKAGEPLEQAQAILRQRCRGNWFFVSAEGMKGHVELVADTPDEIYEAMTTYYERLVESGAKPCWQDVPREPAAV